MRTILTKVQFVVQSKVIILLIEAKTLRQVDFICDYGNFICVMMRFIISFIYPYTLRQIRAVV